MEEELEEYINYENMRDLLFDHELNNLELQKVFFKSHHQN